MITTIQEIKVSSNSNPNKVAGSIAGNMQNLDKLEILAVGAGAVNNTVKSIAIARGFLAPGGIDLICVPAFKNIEIDGIEKSAINFIVTKR